MARTRKPKNNELGGKQKSRHKEHGVTSEDLPGVGKRRKKSQTERGRLAEITSWKGTFPCI